MRDHVSVVLELMTGNDGSVRAAKIQTKHGITNRPIVKLYPLETVNKKCGIETIYVLKVKRAIVIEILKQTVKKS